MYHLTPPRLDHLKADLDELEKIDINVGSEKLKASQCYHFDTSPPHLLFNTNCPAFLKEQLTGIIKKYIPDYESDPNAKTSGIE